MSSDASIILRWKIFLTIIMNFPKPEFKSSSLPHSTVAHPFLVNTIPDGHARYIQSYNEAGPQAELIRGFSASRYVYTFTLFLFKHFQLSSSIKVI